MDIRDVLARQVEASRQLRAMQSPVFGRAGAAPVSPQGVLRGGGGQAIYPWNAPGPVRTQFGPGMPSAAPQVLPPVEPVRPFGTEQETPAQKAALSRASSGAVADQAVTQPFDLSEPPTQALPEVPSIHAASMYARPEAGTYADADGMGGADVGGYGTPSRSVQVRLHGKSRVLTPEGAEEPYVVSPMVEREETQSAAPFARAKPRAYGRQ